MNLKRLQGIKCYRASATCAACRCAASAPRPTPAPARAAQDRRRASQPERQDRHSLISIVLWLTKPKRNPLRKKEAKPEAAAEKAAERPPRLRHEGQPAEGAQETAAAPAPEGGAAAPAADAASRAEARPQSGGRALPRRRPNCSPTTWRARRSSRPRAPRTSSAGVANILATFNNTQVSITDMQGNVIGWSTRRPGGLQRLAQEHRLRRPAGGPGRRPPGHVPRHERSRSARQRSGLRPRIRHPRPAGDRSGDHHHQGRHPGPHNGCRPRKKRRV